MYWFSFVSCGWFNFSVVWKSKPRAHIRDVAQKLRSQGMWKGFFVVFHPMKDRVSHVQISKPSMRFSKICGFIYKKYRDGKMKRWWSFVSSRSIYEIEEISKLFPSSLQEKIRRNGSLIAKKNFCHSVFLGASRLKRKIRHLLTWNIGKEAMHVVFTMQFEKMSFWVKNPESSLDGG